MHNIITQGMPSAVVVEGIADPVSINTDYHHSLQVTMLIESADMSEDVKKQGVLLHYFGRLPVERPAEHLMAALDFLQLSAFRSATRQRTRRSRTRTFDWDCDSPRIIADFLREYGIDLTDRDNRLHWWHFLTLFEGLSDTSATMTAIGWRAAKIPKKVSPEERARIRERKKLYALPPRTKAEIEARQAAIWGD